MTGPLAGVHVLDLARVLAGPYAAMLLGDLGAEVIKVERPGAGDDTRGWGPPFVPAASEQHRGAESTYFLSVNRGKRSVAIDLKDPAERAFVEALVRWADVLVENFRPGVMDRLGLADDRLAELNPRLIRLGISGFGERGPDRDRVGYDQILPYGLFDAADGPLVIAVGNDDIWRRFAPLAGLDPADARFSTNALRLTNLAELQQIMNAALAPHTVADWLDRLRRAGVPAGELKTLDRVYSSEQARAEGLIWEVDHPRLGVIRLPGNPVRYHRSTIAPGLPPPTLGEHTDGVRAAMLGSGPADPAPVQADGN
jgi:crotonobetainyl-CoA:carnitine CoA-transferase CaiB-like acyl-CoA transferase